MTVPLEREFAKVRLWLEDDHWYTDDERGSPVHRSDCPLCALSVIERHVREMESALEWIGTGRHDAFEASSDAEWALGMQHAANAALGKHPLADRFAHRRAALPAQEGAEA